MIKALLFIGVAAVFAATTSSAFAETVTYTGMGKTHRVNMSMQLGNGETAFTVINRGQATLSTTPPSLLEVRCLSLGVTVGEKDFDADIYCSLRGTPGNEFAAKIKSTMAGGTGEIIGGAGKWKGASGEISFKRLVREEPVHPDEGWFTFEAKITTP